MMRIRILTQPKFVNFFFFFIFKSFWIQVVGNAVDEWKAALEAASASASASASDSASASASDSASASAFKRESERKESVAEPENVPDMVIIRITLAVLWNRNFFSGSGSYF
jgi:hypothetical protein